MPGSRRTDLAEQKKLAADIQAAPSRPCPTCRRPVRRPDRLSQEPRRHHHRRSSSCGTSRRSSRRPVATRANVPRSERGGAWWERAAFPRPSADAMLRYLLKRLLATIPVMAVVALFVFSLLLPEPGRPGRGDRRRHRHRSRHRAHPRAARAGPAALRALRQLAVGSRARRSRHLDLHQPAGGQADRAAGRADAGAHGVHADRRGRSGRADGRAGGRTRRRLDRPGRDGLRGARLLGAGVRARLPADLLFAMQLEWLPGAGLCSLQRGLRAVRRT